MSSSEFPNKWEMIRPNYPDDLFGLLLQQRAVDLLNPQKEGSAELSCVVDDFYRDTRSTVRERKLLRAGALAIFGGLGAAAFLGVISAIDSGATRPEDQIHIQRTTLNSSVILRTLGLCGPELRAQADMEQYYTQTNTPRKNRASELEYRVAAQTAEVYTVPCHAERPYMDLTMNDGLSFSVSPQDITHFSVETVCGDLRRYNGKTPTLELQKMITIERELAAATKTIC